MRNSCPLARIALLAWLFVLTTGAAQAALISVSSQAAFSALGTVSQNTNWDSYGDGYHFPGSTFIVGDLTFVEGTENAIAGTGTVYTLARPLLIDNFSVSTTAFIGNTYNMLAISAGNLNQTAGDATFNITTNLGTYSFVNLISSAQSFGALTFLGWQASAGEYFTSLEWGGTHITGITDIQLGNAVPIPPALWLFGSGLLGLVGMARRKKAKSIAVSTIAAPSGAVFI